MIQVFNRFISFKFLIMIAFEGIALFLVVILANSIRFDRNFFGYFADRPTLIRTFVAIVVLQICFYFNDLYDYNTFHDRKILVYRYILAVLSASIILILIFYMVPTFFIGRGVYMMAIMFATVIVFSTRLIANKFFELSFLQENIMILGTGDVAQFCAKAILERKDLGFKIVGFVGTDRELIGQSIVNPKVLGTVNDLEYFVKLNNVRRVVIALQDRRTNMPLRELLNLKFHGVRITDHTSLYEKITGKVNLMNLHPSWFVFGDSISRTSIKLTSKRLFDIVASLLGLILSTPFFVLIPLLIKLDSRGPIFFTQKRIGENNRTFTIIKFRTMKEDAEKLTGPMWASEDDPRITRVGYYLRKFRIDEIPQFLNILAGHMSFVGPRPERPEFVQNLEKEIKYYGLRHSVKPGLTGWAQVRYSYGASKEDAMEKLQYDLYYIKSISFFIDLLIVLKTIKIVLFGRGSR